MAKASTSTVLNVAIATFNSKERKDIRETLRRWAQESALGQRILANLRRERFLSKESMAELLKVFLYRGEAGSEQWERLRQDYVSVCRRLVLQGGLVPSGCQPTLIGRAVPLARLVNGVLDALQGQLVLRDHVQSFVDDLLAKPSPRIGGVQAKWPMARYASWVTWDPDNSGNDPFHFCGKGSAIIIAANLGLPWSYEYYNPSLVLLVCQKPNKCYLVRPTVADAADHEYFQPPDPLVGSDHGWTVPWPAATISSFGGHTKLKARPEALHAPIAFSCLVADKIRMVK